MPCTRPSKRTTKSSSCPKLKAFEVTYLYPVLFVRDAYNGLYGLEIGGVLTYPVLDGKGKGFGNSISIQTVAIVKAAIAAKRVYRVDANHPVC